MLQKLLSFYYTVKYLRISQIRYQVWYRLKSTFIRLSNYSRFLHSELHRVNSRFSHFLVLSSNKYSGSLGFCFLNKSHQFKEEIDWNFASYGKLWNYNLQYFDFLLDDSVSFSDKQFLVENFSENLLSGSVKPEPYPVSLRIINWILFFSETGHRSENFERALKFQIDYLENNLEFHIQANHLLENYITLFISGIALNNPKLAEKAWGNILMQLDEQVLPDGGHYECSPMYHSIILSKLLLIFDIIESHKFQSENGNFRKKVQEMLGWLTTVSFSDKKWPHLNDATDGIAPSFSDILAIAQKLNLVPEKVKLKESGYRNFRINNWEAVIDVGSIIPSYQPGHAHSDMLSFCLQINNKPILVDTGTSTYQGNQQRKKERSTSSHNTVEINATNQSEVWGSFRVGERAEINIHEDFENYLYASHDGYRFNFGIEHFRSFKLSKNCLHIKDRLAGKSMKIKNAIAFFHLDKDCQAQLFEKNGELLVNNDLKFVFSGYHRIELCKYQQAIGFNLLQESSCIKVYFLKFLNTSILQV